MNMYFRCIAKSFRVAPWLLLLLLGLELGPVADLIASPALFKYFIVLMWAVTGANFLAALGLTAFRREEAVRNIENLAEATHARIESHQARARREVIELAKSLGLDVGGLDAESHVPSNDTH